MLGGVQASRSPATEVGTSTCARKTGGINIGWLGPRFSEGKKGMNPNMQLGYIWRKHRTGYLLTLTLPQTNMFAPENGWLEDDRFLLGWFIFKAKC